MIDKPIIVEQGATKIEVFHFTTLADPLLPYDPVTNPYFPFDLTDYKVRSQVRKTYDSTSVELQFDSDTLAPEFIKQDLAGIVTLTISAAATQSLRFVGSEVDYVYDIELYNEDGRVVRPVGGTFSISREVTR